MVKIWLAVALAAVSSLLTMGWGYTNGARFTVILYRMLVSIVIFGGCGFVAGSIAEKKLLPYIRALLSQEAPIKEEQAEPDPDDEENQKEREEPEAKTDDENEKEPFAPFTPESLQRVSPPDI